VLAVIEMILLFEENDIGSSSYFDNTIMVKRWRDIFMSVWDGAWEQPNQYYGSHPHGYDALDYRKQHRPGIVNLFERLKNLAHSWTEVYNERPWPALTLFLESYPLPFFSSVRDVSDRFNKEFVCVELFTLNLIVWCEKEIVYMLSDINHNYADDEELLVLVDVLSFLCQTYEQSADVTEELVQTWRETVFQMWTESMGRDWDETDGLYQNIKASFDRLEAIVQKHPPST
jgi:hypothetical protein